MKKRFIIQFKAFILLLTYLLSYFPLGIFHHHNVEITALDKATPCEKTIYYHQKDQHCHHKTHISNALEKCALCDNIPATPHAALVFFNQVLKPTLNVDYSDIVKRYIFQSHGTFSNKGPPSVLSYFV